MISELQTLLFLKYGGRSVAVFREICLGHEVRRAAYLPSDVTVTCFAMTPTQDLLAVARCTFPSLQDVPVGGVILMASIPGYPDAEPVELLPEIWATICGDVHTVIISLESGMSEYCNVSVRISDGLDFISQKCRVPAVEQRPAAPLSHPKRTFLGFRRPLLVSHRLYLVPLHSHPSRNASLSSGHLRVNLSLPSDPRLNSPATYIRPTTHRVHRTSNLETPFRSDLRHQKSL